MLQSYKAGKLIAAQTSADIWALGVIAYEALTDSYVFPAHVSRAEHLYAAAEGTVKYPWETLQPDAQIARLRVWPSFAACLARAPAARPSAAQLLASLERLVNVTALAEEATSLRPLTV